MPSDLPICRILCRHMPTQRAWGWQLQPLSAVTQAVQWQYYTFEAGGALPLHSDWLAWIHARTLNPHESVGDSPCLFIFQILDNPSDLTLKRATK